MYDQTARDRSNDSSNRTLIMNSLKAKLSEILSTFDTSKRVVLFDYTIGTNVGDLLINLGTERFLSDHKIHVWRRYSANDVPDSIRGMGNEVVILCHGGGNFGDLWPNHQIAREKILACYPRNRVVVLPQTVYFSSPERSRELTEQFRSHGNYHVFVRDGRSLETLQQMGVHESSTMPDMSHYLWGSLLYDVPSYYEALPLRLVRRDKESKESSVLQDRRNTVRSYDWPDILSKSTTCFIRLIEKIIDAQDSMGFHIQRYWLWRPVQNRAIQDGVRFISRYREVYTNRLHAMLLGLLLNRRVCAFDNSYGKLSSYHQTWLNEMNGLTWELEK